MGPVDLALVAAGGAVGSVARYGVTLAAARTFGPDFPWGVLAVNVVGSGAMGLVTGLVLTLGLPAGWRLFVAVGVLGGFTTFSSFSLDVFQLVDRGEAGAALLYVAGSVLLSLAALAGGLAAVRSLA